MVPSALQKECESRGPAAPSSRKQGMLERCVGWRAAFGSCTDPLVGSVPCVGVGLLPAWQSICTQLSSLRERK